MNQFNKISFKQLYTLFENLKPLNLERRQVFLIFSKDLIEKDFISDENNDKFSSLDYIKNFEEYERCYKIYKLREEMNNKIEDEIVKEAVNELEKNPGIIFSGDKFNKIIEELVDEFEKKPENILKKKKMEIILKRIIFASITISAFSIYGMYKTIRLFF